MDKKRDQVVKKSATVSRGIPKSLAIAESGVTTGKDFAQLMSALMSDLLAGRIGPSIGNATVQAGGKLLKVVEMQHKYGKKKGENENKILELT